MNDQSRDSSYEQCAHFYDLFDQKENIEFFYHYASQSGEILDVGAGTGRIAIPLAERGIEVCCVEPSPAMRREFEKKLAQRPDLAGRIRLIAADAQVFPPAPDLRVRHVRKAGVDYYLLFNEGAETLEFKLKLSTRGRRLLMDPMGGCHEPLSGQAAVALGPHVLRVVAVVRS